MQAAEQSVLGHLGETQRGRPAAVLQSIAAAGATVVEAELGGRRVVLGDQSDGAAILGDQSDGAAILGDQSDGAAVLGDQSDGAAIQNVQIDEDVLSNVRERLLPDSVVDMVPDSAVEEIVPDSVVDMVPDSAVEEIVPDSVVDMVPDSAIEEIVPDSDVDMVPDSAVEEMVSDSVVSLCPRCGTFHAGGVFSEECYQALRNARRCARCGLLHEDYDLPAKLFHCQEGFDCEIYIPNVDELVLRGNTIILPDHVTKRLQEHVDKMHEAKTAAREASNCFGKQ